ncbi:phytanoyl-CoA dioxygenase family protein [Paraflavitalea speifideaquila]|uniref:phytanoyl-CoA dioxygenase family protein n=1 Tax=Paraflavitalea speifideaquila TaxID=3076558 RepID=UPI0028E50760|nr:phytanoyl-CoA dioxygenase family protein [Paraflavitalea speifideiaquila]
MINDLAQCRLQIDKEGFAVVPNVFSHTEIALIIEAINQADHSNPTFRKSNDLFAIRQFLKEVPAVQSLVLTERLMNLLQALFGAGYFIVKSIYFDKPEQSNWFVAYHQDLTISVDKKVELPGFGPWTVKQNQFAVQPPLAILERNFTIRIHLDDTDKNNGALKVVPGSHAKGIYRPETIDWSKETAIICEVPQGGMMIMRPLLLHASGRTTNQARRRVIHIEFSNTQLPHGLNWPEAMA